MQQEEYALSKDVDVSLWMLHCKESWAEILLVSMKTCMLSQRESPIIRLNYMLLKGIELLKVWSRSTKAMLTPANMFENIHFLMSPYNLDEKCSGSEIKFFFLIKMLPLMVNTIWKTV